MRFLVDTGAAVSLLNSTVWRKLTAKASLTLEPWLGASLVGDEGSQLHVFGQARTSTCNWNSNYLNVCSGCRRTLNGRNTRYGRVPPAQQQVVKRLLDDMLRDDVIQPSSSSWASPIVLVPTKKDGSPRFCVDYRKLNEVTQKDAYPLPRIDETLETLAESQLFSTLDLASGYWEVEGPSKSSLHSEWYEFKVMPFGLCNAPMHLPPFKDS